MNCKADSREQARRRLADPTLNWAFIGQRISRNLALLPEFSSSKILFAFLPHGPEPDCRPLLQRWLENSKRLFLPRYDVKTRAYEMAEVNNLVSQVHTGRYGILEPLADCPAYSQEQEQEELEIDSFWLVPGLSFTITGLRLGHGNGYYDRLLYGRTGRKIGVAADLQLVPDLPTEDHDVRLDFVITERRTINCRLPEGERELQ